MIVRKVGYEVLQRKQMVRVVVSKSKLKSVGFLRSQTKKKKEIINPNACL